jgi:hypothetical protein
VVEEEKDDTKLGTLLLKTMSKPIPSKLKAEASFGSSSSTSPRYPLPAAHPPSSFQHTHKGFGGRVV